MKITLLVIAAVASVLLHEASGRSAKSCIFTSTMCACRRSTVSSGTCYRHLAGTIGPARCQVATCKAGGYFCDCLGTEICEIVHCPTWRAVAPATSGQKSVACEEDPKHACVKPVTGFKQVQLGGNKRSMFNMTVVKDATDIIAKRMAAGESMHDVWPDMSSMRKRTINMRLLKSADGKINLCAIYSKFGAPKDGHGNMKVRSTITGVAGKPLTVSAVDDPDAPEIPTVVAPNILKASHLLVMTHTDGWCVQSLRYDGKAVTVKFDNVERFEGIYFHGAHSPLFPSHNGLFKFKDGAENGLTGATDATGLVAPGVRGAIPEVTFSLSGIPI
jgi:hypothetical protein